MDAFNEVARQLPEAFHLAYKQFTDDVAELCEEFTRNNENLDPVHVSLIMGYAIANIVAGTAAGAEAERIQAVPDIRTVKQTAVEILKLSSALADMLLNEDVEAGRLVHPNGICSCELCQLRRAMSKQVKTPYMDEKDLQHASSNAGQPSPWGQGVAHEEQVCGGPLQVPGGEAEPGTADRSSPAG